MRVRFACLAFWAGATALAGCGGDDSSSSDGSTCIENLNTGCTDLLYTPPVYPTIFEKILVPQCALGSSCHGSDGAMGGLAITDADRTYDTLLGTKGGVKRVIPHDPTCSPLMLRLESRDPNFLMPRGSRLSEPALCVFVQWIKAGAQRD
jgi:hypothetical protein